MFRPAARLTAAGLALNLALGGIATAQPKAKGHAVSAPATAQVQQEATDRPCPPGLARKSPPCIPPGQARKAEAIGIGSTLAGQDYVVVRSWEYGLEPAPTGSRYVVYQGMLLQIDSTTAEVLTLIRAVDDIVN